MPNASKSATKPPQSHSRSSESLGIQPASLGNLSGSRFRLDSEIIERTKDRIKQQIDELQLLADSSMDLRGFLHSASATISEILGAPSVALWVWNQSSGWQIVYSKELPVELLPNHSDGQLAQPSKPRYAAHIALLDGVRIEGQPVLIPPSAIELAPTRPTNPTDYQILCSRVPLLDVNCELWLEVFQPPSGTLINQRGYLRFCCQMSEMIGGFLRQGFLRQQQSHQNFFRRLAQWLEHCSLHRETIAQATIDLIRDTSEARHAILLTRPSGKSHWRVTAIAGLPKVDRRADAIPIVESAVQRLERDQPKSVLTWITKTEESRLPNHTLQSANENAINDLHQSWSDERYEDLKSLLKSNSVVFFKPQYYPARMNESSPEDLRTYLTEPVDAPILPTANGMENVGLLLAWGRSDKDSSKALPFFTDTVPRDCFSRCSTIVRTAAYLDSFGSRPFNHRVDPRRAPFERPKLIRMAAGLILAAGILAVLAFPLPLQIEASAQLMPISSREIFSPHEGLIEKVFVTHGQHVKAGETCLTIRSPGLQSQLETAYAGLVKSQQRFTDIEGKLLRDRSLNVAERDTLESERDALQQVIALEKSGIANLEHQVQMLQIAAPVNGVVETWQVDSILRDLPVQTGQWLLTIREEEAGWQFEADFPERRVQELMLEDGKPLFAFARLLAAPQTAIPLRLDKDQPLRSSTFATVAGQQNQKAIKNMPTSMRVLFELDSEIPPELMVTGAQARIAVHKGYAPMFWILGKDFFEDIAVRIRMWLP